MSALEVSPCNCATEIDIYLLTYLLTYYMLMLMLLLAGGRHVTSVGLRATSYTHQ